MPNLTPEGLRAVSAIATQNGVSLEAALALLDALTQGGGVQAQFHHPDLGGMGQWSQGGMIMIGDMFNQGLKTRVDRLCHELAAMLRSQPAEKSPSQGVGESAPLFEPGSGGRDAWWPDDLGVPASVGAQNDQRYAYFPDSRRLLVRQNGKTRIYDAGEHRISGVSQQQSGGSSVSFNSQFGPVRIDDLRLISPVGESTLVEASPARAPTDAHAASALSSRPAESGGDATVALIERLADLRQKNILTEEEFTAKKQELLSRL